MENKNPATPGSAAAGQAHPGSNEQGNGTPAVTTPPATPNGNGGNTGNESAGKVILTTEQYRQLERDAARGRSAQRRKDLGSKRFSSQPGNSNGDGNLAPDAQALIDEATRRAEEAERKAGMSEVRGRVRDILDRDEFKGIPKSTRDLILKNPSALSDSEDPEEALLDIEDYLRDEVLPHAGNSGQAGTGGKAPEQKPQDAPGRDTPPVVGSGAPAPSNGPDAEDTSNLHGAAKTRAMIRNKLKGAPTQS